MKLKIFGMLMTLLISTPTYMYSQASIGGQPTTFVEQLDTDNIPIVHLPEVDNQVLQQNAEKIAKAFGNQPYGRSLPIDIDLVKQGKWEYTNTGKKICRLNIKSNSALGIGVRFHKYYLPASGRLFIYSKDKQQILGAFTAKNNKKTLTFVTREIRDNDIIIEYISDALEINPLLKIGGITHIYDDTRWLRRINFGDAASCHNDVNCTPWVSEWCNEIRSVVQFDVIQKFKNLDTGEETFELTDGHCSGVILNNANQDFDPLILSASHCVTGTVTAEIDGETIERTYARHEDWIVYYNFQSPTCSSPSENGNDLMTTAGIEMLYEGNGSPDNTCGDKALFRVIDNDNQIPFQYNVYYAGWNIRDNLEIDGEVTMIHHPRSDVKKISEGILEFRADANYQPDNFGCYYKIEPTNGIIEGGSSGSPLFETSTHQVIGNASFRTNRDVNTCDDPSSVVYGRLNIYFDDIREYLVPDGNLITVEIGGADPIGVCQDEVELFGLFYPGHDWQAKNDITIQAADKISTIKTNNSSESNTWILKSDNSHTNLNNTSDYTLVAGNSIKLNQGFHAIRGNRFNAKIGPCEAFEGCGFNYEARKRPSTDKISSQENVLKRSPIDESIRIFPNPTNGNLTINFPDIEGNNNIRILVLNSLGQVTFTQSITDKVIQLDLSEHPNGLYFVRVVAGEQIIKTEKIILAK